MTAARLSAATVVLGLLLTSVAHAHKPSDAYLQLGIDGLRVDLQLDIALRDLDRELALDADDDGRLTWSEVRRRAGDVAALADGALHLQADGRDCAPGRWQPLRIDDHSDGAYAVLARAWTCDAPARQLAVTYRLFADSDPTHRAVVRLRAGEASAAAVLAARPDAQALPRVGDDHDLPTDGVGTASSGLAAGAGALSFVRAGIDHILAGADHLLFLAALLLPAVLPRRGEPPRAARQALGDVLRVVTSFTVAHSLTLALAVFGLVDPPTRWVETLIAASIALAAAANLMRQPPAWLARDRWKLTFAFGLVHGFGFASALRDTGLSGRDLAVPLLGFNLGVESGQLAVVAFALPALWMLRSLPIGSRVALRGGSAAIVVLGLGWCVQRGFALGPVGFL